MGAQSDVAKAPWRVEAPLTPIAGESLDGFIARVAAASWIDNAFTITSLAGARYGHRSTLATHAREGLPIVADCLQVDVEDLYSRFYPATNVLAQRKFFGVSVHRRDIETGIRRFAPAAMEISPHHRALWQLRPFPFCSETWQYLLERCPRCDAIQRWYHANGIDRCDHCVEELSVARAINVPIEQRPALQLAIGLVHPDPKLRQRSIGELPAEIGKLGSATALELLVRLMGLVDGGMIQNRTGKNSNWSMSATAITSAMAQAWPLLAGWPDAVLDFMTKRIAEAQTRHSDGNGGRSLRFLKVARSPCVPADVANTISRLMQSVQLDATRPSLLKQRTVGINKVAAALGQGTKEIAEVRRKGGLKTIFALKGDRPLALFETDEIRMIEAVVKDRVGLSAAAGRIGISYHGIEQLVAMGALPTAADRYCQVRYSARQTTETALAEFDSRLQHASEDIPLTTATTLRKAAMAIGGRLKPWGPVFHALLTKDIRFCLNVGSASLTDRIIVDRSAIAAFAALKFNAFEYADSTFEHSMTRLDAGEALNLSPKAYTQAINAIVGGPAEAKFVPLHDVLQLAETHISAQEIGMRIGISSRSAFFLATKAGVTLLGPAGWCRQEAQALISAHAA